MARIINSLNLVNSRDYLAFDERDPVSIGKQSNSTTAVGNHAIELTVDQVWIGQTSQPRHGQHTRHHERQDPDFSFPSPEELTHDSSNQIPLHLNGIVWMICHRTQ